MEIQRRTDFVCTACFPWLHFLYITGTVEVEPKILIQIPQLWLLEWDCNRLKKILKGIERYESQEGGISAGKQQPKCGDWARRN